MDDKIVINGVEYIKASEETDTETQFRVLLDGMIYMMVRTYSAGVFAGYVYLDELSKDGKRGIVYKARRIWYWDGAASLSELATYGTCKPENCKFPCEVEEVYLTDIIEMIPITERAKASLDGVPEWKIRQEF